MSPLPKRSKPGMYVATRDHSAGSSASSIRIITAVVVATTLVSDARSKMVSRVIDSAAGSTARLPTAVCHTTCRRVRRAPRPRQLLRDDLFADQRLDRFDRRRYEPVRPAGGPWATAPVESRQATRTQSGGRFHRVNENTDYTEHTDCTDHTGGNELGTGRAHRARARGEKPAGKRPLDPEAAYRRARPICVISEICVGNPCGESAHAVSA